MSIFTNHQTFSMLKLTLLLVWFPSFHYLLPTALTLHSNFINSFDIYSYIENNANSKLFSHDPLRELSTFKNPMIEGLIEDLERSYKDLARCGLSEV